MSIFWFITTLLLLHSCTPGVGVVHGIVDGKVSSPHSRPYMVYIRDPQTPSEACGGFLVREDFVLTAAHCKKDHLMVYLGVDDTNDLPEGIEVDAFPHESFANKPGYDIMLLKLKTPVTLSETVKTIALPGARAKSSSNCMVMGWGWEKYGHASPSRVLREVNSTLLDSENCAIPHTICTEGTAGPSQGDDGGPLICGNVAQGIMSYFIQVESTTYLSIYTQIFHYLPWIREIMETTL
ncbi:granzyme G-like isoform X1 [Misgurnus anguillicaudatus]|uniref:granzyme G-like isoform X1 n=1 Tax=Misgurnus anguillicaudatus TaxID=75329 RepID=UPI003CCF64E3